MHSQSFFHMTTDTHSDISDLLPCCIVLCVLQLYVVMSSINEFHN